jgi:transposase-like protein
MMGSNKSYNQSFRENAVQTLLAPGSRGLKATASKLDLSPSTLYSWKRKYASSSSMKKSEKFNNWTPEKKLDVVIKAGSMNEEELGEFLRSNGLYSSDLEALRSECLPASTSKGRPKLDPEVHHLRKQVKSLSSDLQRKDAALAEYSARVILLKKSHEIWGTKEEDE